MNIIELILYDLEQDALFYESLLDRESQMIGIGIREAMRRVEFTAKKEVKCTGGLMSYQGDDLLGLKWSDVKLLISEKELEKFKAYQKEPSNTEMIFPGILSSHQFASVFYKDGTLWYITPNLNKSEWR